MKVGIIGGHLTPALAVIEQLPKSVELVYFGRKYAMEGDSALSLEYQFIRARGIHFIQFSTGRMQRTFTRHTIPSLKRIPEGFHHASELLKQENVDIVVGFGGYLSVPLCLSAKLLGIPVIIHEQTLGAGLANKIIAPFADKICLSWEGSRHFFPKKKSIVVTGNPLVNPSNIQSSFLEQYSHQRPLLAIVGGSQGAHMINFAIESRVESLLEKYDVIHQTGDAKQFGDYDRLITKRATLPLVLRNRYTVQKFINPDEIDDVYKTADLVIGRAGINTVTTLLLLNKPALLIPIIVGQKQEQLTNARMFANTGLGEILEQDKLTGEVLEKRIDHMIGKIKNYSNNSLHEMKSLHEHAAIKIVEIILGFETKKK